MAEKEFVCDDCGKSFKTVQGLQGHIRFAHKEPGKKEAPPETASITAPKTVNLSGEDLGIADMLIRSGFAKDLNELTHKSLNFTNSNINRIGGYMENPREETLEDVNKMRDRDIVRHYKELQIKAMEKELEGKKEKEEKPSDEDKVIQQMEKQIRLKALKKASSDDDFDFDKLMKYKMMDKMFGSSGGSSEVQAMQNQLNQLQQQLQQERLVAAQQLQNERVIQKIEQMSQAQPGMTAQDVLTFTSDKATAVKEIDIRLQAEKEKLTTEKLNQLQQQIQQAQQGGGLTTQRLQGFREELKAIKEMQSEIGDREKSGSEVFGEQLTRVAEKALPSLIELGKQRMQQQQFIQPQPPQFSEPEQFHHPDDIENSEPIEIPESRQQFSEMTPSEKQISNTMSDMYLKKRR